MKNLINLILANRSLAENNPENLLKFPLAADYAEKHGLELFVLLVESVLDENE